MKKSLTRWMPPLIMGFLALGLLMAADPIQPPAEPKPTTPLEIEGVDWDARAEAWFENEDPKMRRREMKQFTKALKRPCKHCHSKDFKSYPDARLKLVSQQMMHVSKTHGVACKDCHAGRDAYTPMGETSKQMWAISLEQKVDCSHCHTPNQRFAALTEAGETFKKTSKKKLK
ncbi:MAG: cytochrome c3 family protein [Bradymonadia bacterium]